MFLERPLIPIEISIPGHESIPYPALVDSGADWCLFHAEVGEELGLRIEEGMPTAFVGVEGSIRKAYFHEVLLHVGDFRVSVAGGFLRGYSFAHGVLGQQGFFSRFRVVFNAVPGRAELEIEPLSNLRGDA